MIDTVTYEGPLASYLENVQGRSSDDGRPPIRQQRTSDSGTLLKGVEDRPRMNREASHRPLITAEQATSRRSRFQALFSTAMSTKLSPRENSRFVDRFRYIICTSQLLSETIVSSDYTRQMPLSTINGPDEQIHWDSRKAAKYWMGSGGCVLLVSLLISWAMRAPERGISAKARQSAAVTLTLVTALFLYAQSRRTYTRYLHSQAVLHIQECVSHCQKFDTLACRFINLIQDVELVSRGYRIETVLTPIARIEANSRHRRCVRLRTAVSSALNLIFCANGRACTVLDQLTNLKDYNKLSDVYNIILNDDDDLSLLCDEVDSVGHLRALFNQMYARRRKLLCCLLAVHADGRPGNARIWRVVVEQLRVVSGLVRNLVRQLEDTLHEDSHVLEPNQLSFLHPAYDTGNVTDRRRTQVRSINTLSNTLRRTQAKMCILREESGRLLQQPELEARSRQELLDHYDSLGSDLHALLSDWQEGRHTLEHGAKESEPSPKTDMSFHDSADAFEDNTGDLDTKSLLIRPNSLGFWGPRVSTTTLDSLSQKTFPSQQNVLAEEVFEAEEKSATGVDSRTRLTRAERVAIMRQEREIKQARSEERRMQQQARLSMQGELKDVLGHRSRRPLGLRLSVHNIHMPASICPSTSETVTSPPLSAGDRKISTASQQSSGTIDSGVGSSIVSVHDY